MGLEHVRFWNVEKLSEHPRQLTLLKQENQKGQTRKEPVFTRPRGCSCRFHVHVWNLAKHSSSFNVAKVVRKPVGPKLVGSDRDFLQDGLLRR